MDPQAPQPSAPAAPSPPAPAASPPAPAQPNPAPQAAEGGLAQHVPQQFETANNKVGVIGIVLLALTTISLFMSVRHHRAAYKALKDKKENTDREISEIKVNLKNVMGAVQVPYETVSNK